MGRALIAAAVTVALTLGVGCGQRGSNPAPAAGTSSSAASLQWASSWDNAFKQARGDGRVVMVEFYADWCVWCKRMESTTFTEATVVNLLADRVVPLRVDAEREGRILAQRFNVEGFPTILFLDGEERELGRIPGFMDAGAFASAIRGWVQ